MTLPGGILTVEPPGMRVLGAVAAVGVAACGTKARELRPISMGTPSNATARMVTRSFLFIFLPSFLSQWELSIARLG